MAGQTDRLLTRARERFAVQDYYGAVHLLEEIVDGGRAFADVHHLLGRFALAAGPAPSGRSRSSGARWSSTRATSRR